MLMILFALISAAATAQVTGGPPATQQNRTIEPSVYRTWCVCKPYSSLTKLRYEVSWACENGADCSPIEKGGLYENLSFTDQVSYAFNDFYQKDPTHRQCYFHGAARITNKDPSTPTCKFPSNSTSTFPASSSTRREVPNLGSFLWGLGFTYLAYLAAQIA
ncbi:unnamed protein product [Microthlaspi erraticum]|uniref:X8 domain-containing protein n=1 Tax=Microthlaspi erraticum TaxID=1685480 RepID=A0A6D2HKP4_9BRAS|nr:unnamed protein product [Microthlaspi erraticum]